MKNRASRNVGINSRIAIILILALMALLNARKANAMTPGTSTIKHKAFFVSTNQGLYEPLDLKFKRIHFDQKDFEWCLKNMKREKDTLNFSCEFQIPQTASVSKLRKVLTPQTLSVDDDGSIKVVDLSVDPEARKILVRTSFDKTGIDFDLVQFNKHFIKGQGKLAKQIFEKALSTYALEMEILESSGSFVSKNP